ncbi:unnamed protein product [Dicrocoelium dendriticum]|nr:unnamed protein product [Dicrocoelium dendriticum]
MTLQLSPTKAVPLVCHWFSLWNELEREIFIESLMTIEQTNCYLPVSSHSAFISENESRGSSALDVYLSDLMRNELQLLPDSRCPSVFECQLRLFQSWYPTWSLEQRHQLAECLKELQLQCLYDAPNPCSLFSGDSHGSKWS